MTDVPETAGDFQLITNADQGVLLTWVVPPTYTIGMATTVGTSVTVAMAHCCRGRITISGSTMQAEDGSFVAFENDGSSGNIVAFSANGSVRWFVRGDYPVIATAGGGVIGQSGITYDQNGSATGHNAFPTTYDWFGYAYLLGAGASQVLAPSPIVATGFWAFNGANNSGSNTAIQQQRFVTLLSCWSTGSRRKSAPGSGLIGPLLSGWTRFWHPRVNFPLLSGAAGDSIWNAKNDLAAQMSDPACRSAALSFVFSKIGPDINGRSVTPEGFANYIQYQPRFYDGTKSTLDYKYAFCGENYHRLNCGGSMLTIKGTFADTSLTTAITVTPSYPFRELRKRPTNPS